MGEGWTAVTGEVGIGRNGRPTYARHRPDRQLARYPTAASRTDQASGHADNSNNASQRLRSAGDKGGRFAGTAVDRPG